MPSKRNELRGKAPCWHCHTMLWLHGDRWADEKSTTLTCTKHFNHRPDPERLTTVSLRIENRYELYPTVITAVFGAQVLTPTRMELASPTALQAWALEYLFDFTGAGHPDRDSSYTVNVSASSLDALQGKEFEFGDL